MLIIYFILLQHQLHIHFTIKEAAVAQLVERQLPKLEVAGSSPVCRSFFSQKKIFSFFCLFSNIWNYFFIHLHCYPIKPTTEMKVIIYNIAILIFATLSLILLIILLFGTIEKRQPRNSLGLPKGKSRYYFTFQNEKIQIRHFLIIYLLSALFLGYYLYKIFA